MTIYIIAIEPIDTRYTGHWYTFVPEQIKKATGKDVVQISGDVSDNSVSDGAFLNFASTNIWKNDQASKIAGLFSAGTIEDGDYFLFMDAWNPTAIEVRYMADLFDVSVKMGGIWHAGAYDSNDFLGRKIKNKRWAFGFEAALYELYDHNFFATLYHKKLFEDILCVSGKSNRVGFPMEYSFDLPLKFNITEKENLIVFPHRISPEKQPELFRSLAKLLPQYEFVVCQDKSLTKDEYHAILRKAKIVFSANLQETLGIGVFEGMLAGALPFVPNRLSYTEMYDDFFTFGHVVEKDLPLMAHRIKHLVENYEHYLTYAERNLEYIKDMYFTGTKMYNIIGGST